MGKGLDIVAGFILRSAICAVALLAGAPHKTAQAATSDKPNIIFVILDDVGIDQLALFGNGGLDPPKIPNLELIAKKGVKFTNVWATPECSPSRATLMTGRFALRTGVEDIIAENHLPQSYMSSFEATLPRILAKAGYTSAMMGKYHLGDTQDPAGACAPLTRGFTVFRGDLAGEPKSIDATAGGIDPKGKQTCGYFQTKAAGACYTAPNNQIKCSPINADNAEPGTDPARTCLQHGGIFVPNNACGVGGPTLSDFSRYNAYYVSQRWSLAGVLNPLYVNPGDRCQSTIDRRYLTQAQGQDGEFWWKQQRGPRMLTLSLSSMHTPYQKAPTNLVLDPQDSAATCSATPPQRTTLNSMLEGADVQIGRTLANLGLATLGPDRRTLTSLNLGNTMLVIMGDNGTQGTATRAPFNPARAKSTVYQTGIWVPLIIAGPMVRKPNRSVDDMISSVDLYQLFGDVAGIDVRSVVPPSHVLDSRPMLPYLTDPAASELRVTNFTQSGIATFSPDPSQRSWPCQIGNICDDTLFGPGKQALCEVDNGGTWYGPGGKKQVSSCCAVQTYLNQTSDNPPNLSLAPVHQRAIRGGRFRGVLGVFKLIEMETTDCSKPITSPQQSKPFPWAEYQTTSKQEFYDLSLTKGNPKGLDNAPYNLAQNCAPGQDLATCLPTAIDVNNYKALNKALQQIKNSANAQNTCQAEGDGNEDMRVTQADLNDWKVFNGKGPSRYDINLDGATDDQDRAIIQANLGHDCLPLCKRADLDRDGTVGPKDMGLLKKQTGVCTDEIFCGGDLNGDGKVNTADVQLMTQAQNSCN